MLVIYVNNDWPKGMLLFGQIMGIPVVINIWQL